MKKILIKLGVVFLFLISCVACDFAPGSYPYAEEYEFKCNEPDLISAVEIFKRENPDYCVPISSFVVDGRRKNMVDHWYHVYFYIKDENKILKTWIRQLDSKTTNFAFVAVKFGVDSNEWKLINRELSSENNKIEKEKFEKRILSKIKEIVQRNK